MKELMLCAGGGALAIQLLGLLELRNVPKAQRPEFRDLFYWLPFLVGPLIGAGLVYVYYASNVQLDPIVALNVGVSAPLILRTMAAANPFKPTRIDPGEGA